MVILLIVLAVVVVLALVLGMGGFGGFGGADAPVVRRRVVYRRPARRVVTEHRIVEDPAAPYDDPLYRP